MIVDCTKVSIKNGASRANHFTLIREVIELHIVRAIANEIGRTMLEVTSMFASKQREIDLSFCSIFVGMCTHFNSEVCIAHLSTCFLNSNVVEGTK